MTTPNSSLLLRWKQDPRTIQRTLLFIAAIITFHTRLLAQHSSIDESSRFLATTYDQEQGLAQNSVKSMLFDKQGFLWLATEDGLSRFDGKHFTTYRLTGNINRVRSLFIKNKDTLLALSGDNLIYTISNGNVKYDGPYNYRLHGLLFTNLNTVINTQLLDQYGGLDMRQPNNMSPGLQWGYLLKNGLIGVWYPGGVAVYNNSGKYKKITIPFADWSRLFASESYFAYLENDNQYVSIYDTTGFIKRIPLPFPPSAEVSLIESQLGSGSFISCNKQLYKIEITDKQSLKLTPLLDNFRDGATIRKVLVRDSNTLIAGSVSRGLNIYTRRSFKTTLQPSKVTSQNFYYAQVLMPDRQTVLTGGNKLFSEKGYIGQLKDGRPDPEFRAALKDRNDKYWYAKPDYSGRFNLYNTKYPGRNEEPAIQSGQIAPTAMYEDSRKRIWVANRSELGYFIRDKYFPVQIDSPRVSVGWIDYITETNEGNILIASIKGIFFYNETTNQLLSKFLNNVDVRFVKVDSNNNLWAATYGSGFYFINTRTNKVQKFPLDRSKYLSSVHCIIEDGNGRYWLPTNHGIFVTTKKSLIDFCEDSTRKPFYYYYDKSAGLYTNEFNGGCQPAYLMHPDGYCSLPSIDGLVWFKPDETAPVFPDKSIQIDLDGSEKIKLDATDESTFHIERSETNVELKISSPNWIHPENIVFEYNLRKDGSRQKDWYRINETQTITFSYLPHGKYTLSIRKKTGFHYNDYTIKTFTILVPPAWYQTIWFYLLSGACIILGVVAYYKWRIWNFKRRSELLEQRISIATEDILKMNDELAKINQVKNKLLGIFNHDISYPIYFIHKELERVIQTAETDPPTKNQLTQILQSASQLKLLASEILQWIKLQYSDGKFSITKEPTKLAQLIASKWEQLEVPARQKQIQLACDVPHALTVDTDKSIMGIIVYNILLNVVKHNSNSLLSISLHQETDQNGAIIRFENTLNQQELSPLQWKGEFEAIDVTEHHIGPDIESSRYGLGVRIITDLAAVLDISVAFRANDNGFSVSLQFPEEVIQTNRQV